MAIQNVNLGSAPTGAGGDTFRSAAVKINENFTNNIHAASRQVGLGAGNVMEVGAFGIGQNQDLRSLDTSTPSALFGKGLRFGLMSGAQLGINSALGMGLVLSPWADASAPGAEPCILGISASNVTLRSPNISGQSWYKTLNFLTENNTTVDSNGFIKKASPIVKIFAEKIESNDEASEQKPIFEKVDVGHYLLKNTEGFSDDGWYIEMPKDANGNVLVAVQYRQLEDNTIEVKTFAKKLDEETGDIVPNLEKPRDIPIGRWIDIRVKELPKPDIEFPISNTPPEFQPTNLAKSVVEALKNDSEQ